MKHCPNCNIDFADKFDDCFQCGTELVEGAVEQEGAQSEAEALIEAKAEQEARGLLEKVKVGAALFLCLAIAALGLSLLLDPTLAIKEQWVLIHQEGRDRALLRQAGALKTASDCQTLAEETGLNLPKPGPGEMIIYYPITSKKVIPTYKPLIADVRKEDGAIYVSIGRSEEKVSPLLRVLGAAMNDMFSAAKRPTVQFVVTARVQAADGPIKFRAPKNLGIDEHEQTVDIAMDYSAELTMGWTKTFLWYVIFGGVGLLVFTMILLKFA